ncbi:MAG: endolytic transglycosylase MltG [Wenzhouxiangella sp.]|jgi:UPF0755 protein|nr:endolytic transglycosylase MltG [Wenzhouxiangella sp.]
MIVAATLLAGYGLQCWQSFQDAPVNPDGELNIWLPPGSTLNDLVTELEQMGLARRGWEWRVLGRVAKPGLKAGEYRIAPQTRVREFLDLLATGQARQHRLTIVEGWTLSRLRTVLQSDPRLRTEAADMTDAQLMAVLGCEGCFAEGWFLPETYFFTRGSTDLDLLRRSHEAMREALMHTWDSRDPTAPLQSPEEMLVLASIIERETGAAAERSKVAGVFARRLNLGMRLQTDPTVIYGLGPDFEGRLRRVHLRTDHPWNTYTRHGLPPTPIALPGLESLRAAAQPAEGTALYFVSRGDGTHQFSDTLAEHNAAVNRYIRGR